ncbi:MAG: hypothetical protein QXR09_02905 [Candidatus Aenigmatarchaeota archaeon]
MKAQISFVEFLTSITIFLGFTVYIAFQISTFIPNYLNEIKAERMRCEAFQLSELLINDPGDPVNWYLTNFNNVKRLGLLDETKNRTNFLSENKILAFEGNCSKNYQEVKRKLELDYDFSLILKDGKSGEIKINCYPSATIKRYTNTTIRRIVAYEKNGEISYGEMLLQVW